MTDNEIIKALECCGNQMYSCTDKIGNVLDPINHQNVRQKLKAEIERLRRENIALNRTAIPSSGTILKVGNALLFAENKEDYDITINTIKTEAYKELAEMLKERVETQQVHYSYRDIVEVRDIDNVLKKLTEKGGAE